MGQNPEVQLQTPHSYSKADINTCDYGIIISKTHYTGFMSLTKYTFLFPSRIWNIQFQVLHTTKSLLLWCINAKSLNYKSLPSSHWRIMLRSSQQDAVAPCRLELSCKSCCGLRGRDAYLMFLSLALMLINELWLLIPSPLSKYHDRALTCKTRFPYLQLQNVAQSWEMTMLYPWK